MSTALDAHADIDGTESVFASYEHGLVDLEAEDLRLEEVDGGAVDVDETAALLGVCYRGGSLVVQCASVERSLVRVVRRNNVRIPSFCRKSEQPLLSKPFCQVGGSAGLLRQ